MGSGLFGLGTGTPSRFPYPDRPQGGPGIGAGSGQNLRARTLTILNVPGSGIFGPDFILNTQGAFWYNGTEGPNTLSVSIVPGNALVQDPYGNWAPPGVSRYTYNPGIPQATVIQDFQGVTSVFVGPTMTGGAPPYTLITGVITIIASTGPAVVVISLTGTVQATNGTPANPTVITTDVWNTLAPINGWANVTTLKYTLLPTRMVMVAGVITSAGAAGNPIFANLPAGYRPATQQETAAGLHGPPPAGGAFMRVATNGDLSILGSTIGTGPWSVNWTFSLDYA